MAALAPTQQDIQQQLDEARDHDHERRLLERLDANPHLNHWKLARWVLPGVRRRIRRLEHDAA